MTFTDAVRQLMHDPIRLGALRSPSGLAPIMPTTGRGFLSLLTDGRLVWKTEHGQRMTAYMATCDDVLAEDWEVSDMTPTPSVPGGGGTGHATPPPTPPRPPTGQGPIGQTGNRPGASALSYGRSPSSAKGSP